MLYEKLSVELTGTGYSLALELYHFGAEKGAHDLQTFEQATKLILAVSFSTHFIVFYPICAMLEDHFFST